MNYVTTKEYFLHFAYVVAILWELNVVEILLQTAWLFVPKKCATALIS